MPQPHTETPLWAPTLLRKNKRAVLRTIAWTLLLPGLLAAIAALALGIGHERPVSPDGDPVNTGRTCMIVVLALSSFGLLLGGWMRWLSTSTELEVTAQREKLREIGRRIMVKIDQYTTGHVDPDHGPRCDLWLSWVRDGEPHQTREGESSWRAPTPSGRWCGSTAPPATSRGWISSRSRDRAEHTWVLARSASARAWR